MSARPLRRRAGAVLAHGAALALLLAPLRAEAAGVTLGFQDDTLLVAPGGTLIADLTVPFTGAAFNAFDASVRFDPAWLTFLPTVPVNDQRGPLMTTGCSNTYHLFSAQPDSLAITLVLLCGGQSRTGPGVIYRVKFTASTTPGWTRLRFGPFTQFYFAGSYVNPLIASEAVVKIGNPPPVAVDDRPPVAVPGLSLAPPQPNPARGARGVTLRFELAGPDDVGFDLLDALGRRVASRPAERFGAGSHALVWEPGALAAGRYLLRARGANGRLAARGWVVLD
jgi:hypothetical protein